jgi:hypothetical protein
MFGPVTATISPEADVDWYLARVRWPSPSRSRSRDRPQTPRSAPTSVPSCSSTTRMRPARQREDGLAGQRTLLSGEYPPDAITFAWRTTVPLAAPGRTRSRRAPCTCTAS